MVLLENFGAEPLAIKLRRPNYGKFVDLFLRPVTQPMTPGIPKFGKRAILKGPGSKGHQFIDTF
jgi:hypothetical protein